MNDARQSIPAHGISRLTLDTTGADVSVRWVDELESITIVGAELPVDRAEDEIFLRADLRGRREMNEDDEVRIPDFVSPGEFVEEILKQSGLFAGFGRSKKGVPLHIQAPTSIRIVSLEVNDGDLLLEDPRHKVDCTLKRGAFASSGGHAELSLESGSGDVYVSGLSGSARISGGSGDITLVDVNAITNVKAGSGSISLSRVTGDAIKLAAGSGDIEILDCRADAYSSDCGSGDVIINGGYLSRISIRTGSGDVRCAVRFDAFAQSVTTGSGSVSFGVPHDLSARIEAFTSAGDIDTELPLMSVGQRGPKSRRSQRQVGSVGTGEPRAEVSVRTSSGDIRVHWLQFSAGTGATPTSSPVSNPPPSSKSPSAEGSAGAPARSGDDQPASAPAEDEWKAVLESLSRGELTVDEAEQLLGAIERRMKTGTA